jgi:hypothetical protein
MDAATANRLSAIATETEQLQNEIEGHRSVLNYLLRSVRTMDPAKKEARIRATRERIEGLEERQEALKDVQCLEGQKFQEKWSLLMGICR